MTNGETDADREPYGVHIGRLRDDYPDFTILARSWTGPEAGGWTARMIPPPGIPGNGRGAAGPDLIALTCDELAARMDAARAAVIEDAAPGPAGDLRQAVADEVNALWPA
jgi:hypothetical protein